MASSLPPSSENNDEQQQPAATEPISKSELKAENPTTTFTTNNKDASSLTSQSESDTIRSTMDGAMHTVSDTINNNLVAARMGVMASVVLLGAYGIANTPLFFRFRTIHEVPSSYFVGRKRLYGRIVEVDTKSSLSSCDGSIYVYVRHLSPVGQILPKTWFDFFQRMNTTAVAAASTVARSSHKRDLLKVKIAGVQYPPFSNYRYKTEEYLERMARDRTLVSCQLLARQIPKSESCTNIESKRALEEAFPELKADLSDEEKGRHQYRESDEDTMGDISGVCKLAYRPTLFQLFPTDIAVSLLLSGNATIAPTLLASNHETADGDDDHASTASSSTTIVNSSQRLDDLRNDAKYLERLAQAEFEALKKESGIWAYSEVRETKADDVAEIEFQASANIFQKLWRRLRGG
ncbi:unnamed protein product [Cylindrotheca closterium]|uniref:Uncharacterized protein n=1 Tax=Cylindrotheca closterium TaxID=2856 RepID=A0AAD2JJ08_9STRA|nr:unnamed protein product [Cylindrotheca closterium]